MRHLRIIGVLVILIAVNLSTGGAESALSATTVPRERRAEWFLTKIRLADPDYRLILMACFKDGELNLLLSRFVTADQIPVLTKGLLGQLSKTLPGESVSVIAFRPVVPLREAAIVRLNSQTGEVLYYDGPNPALSTP